MNMEISNNRVPERGDWRLINFSATANKQIIADVQESGYRVIYTDGLDWLRYSPVRLNGPTLFLFDRNNFPQDRLIKALDVSVSTPRVGIFAESCRSLQNEITYRCDDFIELPCSNHELKTRLNRVLRFYAPGDGASKEEILAEFAQLNLVGASPRFVGVLQDIKQFAKYDAPVLITGETGTGKELVAWAIHEKSNRQKHAFIPVNCGAIPDNLFENEFFGHVKGAYTDAGLTQQGLVEQAESGSLFLDEVDSLSAKAQVALLRFLQNQEFRPLGGRQFKKANVRIIAATNADLCAKVASGEFRSDLYYRLNILQLNLPSLLQRMQDIPLLCNYFLEKFYRQYGGERRQFSLATLNWMMQQPWPGNIRELENFILRAYLSNDGTLVTHDGAENGRVECLNNHLLLNMDWDTDGQFANAKTQVVEEFEKTYLDWILRKTKGNVSDAAKQAGKERRSLGKLLKKYAIDKAKYYS